MSVAENVDGLLFIMTCENMLVELTFVTMFKCAVLGHSYTLCNHHHPLSPELCHLAQWKLYTHQTAASFSPAPRRMSFHFLSLDLMTLGTSYPWNHNLSSWDCFTSPHIRSSRFTHSVARVRMCLLSKAGYDSQGVSV